jgi:hypothetical protein
MPARKEHRVNMIGAQESRRGRSSPKFRTQRRSQSRATARYRAVLSRLWRSVGGRFEPPLSPPAFLAPDLACTRRKVPSRGMSRKQHLFQLRALKAVPRGFCRYELVSVCGIWQWRRHSCLLSQRAFFGVSFLMCAGKRFLGLSAFSIPRHAARTLRCRHGLRVFTRLKFDVTILRANLRIRAPAHLNTTAEEDAQCRLAS